ncbi:hypothetical protein A1507_10965 [Methylomonas koyamae]|uniref:Glycosyltransferase RgtA/B/C/D-like domain-containing protein n=1 Tax=Methylomonas koyamae TaxID=702114 RepID=A0A177NH51_9GAMM|nr:hypothetical protein A1507_10965 [Methylomonas koyamae]
MASIWKLRGMGEWVLSQSQRSSYWVLLAISLLIAAHLYFYAPIFPYSPDSASYIERARNLKSAGNLLDIPYGVIPGDVDQIENHLFPVGYPLVLAAISVLGVDPKVASVAIGNLSSLLLPFMLFWTFRRGVGNDSMALAIVGLSVLAPGLLTNAPYGLTDVFSLLLVVAAVGCVLRLETAAGWFLAGILAGVAYSVRNANLALLAALALYACYYWKSSRQPERHAVVRCTLAGVCGVSLVVLPMLLRNFWVFGAMNPYQMEPSTIGLVENIRTYIEALMKDVTACKECARFIAWSIPGLLTIFWAFFFAFFWLYRFGWQLMGKSQRNAVFFSGVYFALGSCLVILARTRYQWGEPINLRHVFQYTPFLFLIMLSIMQHLSCRMQKFFTLVLFGLCVFRAAYAIDKANFVSKKPHFYANLQNALSSGRDHLCSAKPDVFLASNWAYLFRIECDVRARQIEGLNMRDGGPTGPGASLMDIILTIQNNVHKRPVRVGLFPGSSGVDEGDLPISGSLQHELSREGWIVVQNTSNSLLLELPR